MILCSSKEDCMSSVESADDNAQEANHRPPAIWVQHFRADRGLQFTALAENREEKGRGGKGGGSQGLRSEMQICM